MSLRQRRILWAYAFLFVPLLFFLVIRIYPTLSAFNISLHTWNPLSDQRPFVGLANYQKLWQEMLTPTSVTRKAFENTLKYVLIGVPLQLALGLGFALLLNSIYRLVSVFRMIYFIPFVTSAVAVAWVWRWLYQPDFGAINLLLSAFHLPTQRFLFDPSQSLLSIVAVVVWQGLGFTIIIFLAGLQQIPDVYYDAARVDGAGRWPLFRHITLPLLNSTIVYLAVLQTIAFLRMFTEVLNMTRQGDGGPLNTTTTVVLRIYREGFGSLNMGYASALSVALFIIILAITVIQLRFLQRRFDY
ncbi:MAG: sugar ABC transporter permease [Anaerolineae bacterium]|nr:sugar ABC transporter permease [Anaerolineae bacterium]